MGWPRGVAALAPALALALTVGAGCDSFGSGNDDFLREQLVRAENVWATSGSTDYTLVVTRGCDCPVQPRQVELAIAGDAIVSAIYTDTGEPVDTAVWRQYATVSQLFALVRDALDRRAPTLQVEYNQEFGYPELLVINYDRTRTDDDVLFLIEGYAPALPGSGATADRGPPDRVAAAP
jgi:hypothetical protein